MPPLATIGILSIGEMGMGIAKLLIANNYRVVTNLEGRSADTETRVKLASIEALRSDSSLVYTADYILSIVPPRDALSTAQRIAKASNSLPKPRTQSTPLYYLDLNAISPKSARAIGTLFATSAPSVLFIDGGIIGGAPSLKSAPAENTTVAILPETSHAWTRPSIPLSGPNPLTSAPVSGSHLQDTLNAKWIGDEIGTASGLKCCFASCSKGFTAIAIQSFTTASALGVLPHLQEEMGARMPGLLKSAGGMTTVPPKAYRWVREMEEIGECHSEEGGFDGGGKGIFDGVAGVYKAMAEDSVLGAEKTERRKRGLTVEDVTGCMGEGLRKRRKKLE